MLLACARPDPNSARGSTASGVTPEGSTPAVVVIRESGSADSTPLRDTAVVPPLPRTSVPPGSPAPPSSAGARVLPFVWCPPGASPRSYCGVPVQRLSARDSAPIQTGTEPSPCRCDYPSQDRDRADTAKGGAYYAAPAPEDQHHLVLTPGVARGGRYPVVMAFHGQPRRGQLPRDYAFARKVTETVLDLVERREIEPVVLVLPVFRYEGQNWPAFDLAAFGAELTRLLGEEGISGTGYLLFGHSAAAGCGGRGLNEAERLQPRAVGFFDTCVGPGLGQAVRALRRAEVPTLLLHSVETAGFRPRPPVEYVPDFDFGRVYRPLGLEPLAQCPTELPEAPLRSLPYRCAADAQGITRALVVDTGEGQEGHDAVVPVAVRYFLRQHLAPTRDVGARRQPSAD